MGKLKLHCILIDLGEVKIKVTNSALHVNQLKFALLKTGLELIDEQRTILVEKIKNIVVEIENCEDKMPRVNTSATSKLNHNYADLSDLFSKVKGITIEHYIIQDKIEQVKELNIYEELN